MYKFDGIGIHEEPNEYTSKDKMRSIKIEIESLKKGEPNK